MGSTSRPAQVVDYKKNGAIDCAQNGGRNADYNDRGRIKAYSR